MIDVKCDVREVADVLHKCNDAIGSSTMYPDKTYEKGVSDAINWLILGGRKPMDSYVLFGERATVNLRGKRVF